MANHKPVKINQDELKNAENMWHNFIIGSKYVGILTAVILIGLALAFVDF